MSVHQQTFELTWPDESERVVRGRAMRPGGPQKRPLPAVLILHGFKGFMDWGFFPLFQRGLAESGFLAVSFIDSKPWTVAIVISAGTRTFT